jgi:hypothetical protein
LHRIVLHRIVERNGEVFVFQGDNNEHPDDERVGASQLVGRMWVRAPHGGAILAWFVRPLHISASAAVVLLVAGAFSRLRRRGARKPAGVRRARRARAAVARASTAPITANVRNVVLGCGVAALALSAVAYTRAPRHLVDHPVAYTHRGDFSYDAPVGRASVYEGRRAETGDVVFRRLTKRVNVTFRYRFATAAPHDVSGTVKLVAVLSSPSGWSRTLSLRELSFSSDDARVTATLDLPVLDLLMAQMETATGVVGGDRNIAIVAQTDVTATFAGATKIERYSPEINFASGPLTLRPAATAPAPASDAGSKTESSSSPYETSRDGRVPRARMSPAELRFAGRALDVESARSMGLKAGIPLLLLGSALTLVSWRSARSDVPARIRARYGRSLVPVDAVDGDAMRPVVDVSNIEALMHLAESQGALVLSHAGADTHTYFIDIGGVVYRYQLA